MSIRITIADDHALISEGIRNMLRHDPAIRIIASYTNGTDLIAGLREEQPDVLLLDIGMPEQMGDELARIISRDFPEVRIMALTNLDNIYYVKTMLQQGVIGYVLKNVKREVLIEAIETVCDGRQYLDATIREKIALEKASVKRRSAYGDMLTRREKEVLRLIAENITSKEIAEKLHVSKRTIDHHRESMLSKLDVKNVSALVKKAIDLGLLTS